MIGTMSADEVRIGDAERTAAADRLGEDLVSGRLTPEEHAERLDAVLAARTRKELAVPFEDLPALTQDRSPAPPATLAKGTDIWNRLTAASSGIALVVFFIIGFGFGGWAWAWIVFLLPGIFASMANAGDRRR